MKQPQKLSDDHCRYLSFFMRGSVVGDDLGDLGGMCAPRPVGWVQLCFSCSLPGSVTTWSSFFSRCVSEAQPGHITAHLKMCASYLLTLHWPNESYAEPSRSEKGRVLHPRGRSYCQGAGAAGVGGRRYTQNSIQEERGKL